MTTTQSSDSPAILKVDTQGRVRTPRDKREAVLDEFDRSGMSGAAFARHCGIKYATFAAWRRARDVLRQDNSRRPGALELAEVVLGHRSDLAKGVGDGLRVELPGGATLWVRRPEDARLAAVILDAIGQRAGER